MRTRPFICAFVRSFLCSFLCLYGQTFSNMCPYPCIMWYPMAHLFEHSTQRLPWLSYSHHIVIIRINRFPRNAACRGQTTGHRGLELAWRWILGIEQHEFRMVVQLWVEEKKIEKVLFARLDSDAYFNDIWWSMMKPPRIIFWGWGTDWILHDSQEWRTRLNHLQWCQISLLLGTFAGEGRFNINTG